MHLNKFRHWLQRVDERKKQKEGDSTDMEINGAVKVYIL